MTERLGPRPDRAAILSAYDFAPDVFQNDAFDVLDAGHHVIVAAPTGSGKTVVGEYALEAARRDGKRSFYTTPIKALSNQKFRDLVDRYSDDDVGLLTGDTTINGDAQIVVMTTEVLRNMMYAGRDLADLGAVVLDEVHFLMDAYRGPVWEEVIIHLPQHVQLACLSATVSNTAQLAEWMTTVRGETRYVIEHTRPVELDNMYLIADRTERCIRLYHSVIDGKPNPTAARMDASAIRFRRDRRRASKHPKQQQKRRKLATPSREEVLQLLISEELTPSIFFIFSRSQCDEAARQCARLGVDLTNDHEKAEIERIAYERLASFSSDDLATLRFDEFLAQLTVGVAAHHAGLVPPFKEVVERCFAAGLVKVVFATETLAVGINMPARSVVIDKLTKFNGDGHETLTPGQYTQLTGRAGRRGIDDHGTAIVLWNPYTRFDEAAELALSRSFHLRSVFRPTYNMIANLVGTYDAATARQLISLSFAQFQADSDVVKTEKRLSRAQERLVELAAQAASPYGDIDEYRALVAGARPVAASPAVERSLARLKPGAVLRINSKGYTGLLAVVATAQRSSGVKVTGITQHAEALQLTGADFVVEATPIAKVVLPGAYAPKKASYRHEVAKRLSKFPAAKTRSVHHGSAARDIGHPVEADPAIAQRLRTADERDRVSRRVDVLSERLAQRSGRLAAEFDGVLAVLERLDYVDPIAWQLTDRGQRLSRVFHECDLLVAEAIHAGIFDNLDPASLAGLLSCCVYEHRSREDPPTPWFPNAEVSARWKSLEEMSARLQSVERTHGVTVHRSPDPTFFAIAYAWVAGEGFAEVVDDDDLTGGDFVRTMKQLIDLCGQVAQVAPLRSTARAARLAGEAAFRDVIADSSVSSAVDAPPQVPDSTQPGF